jgi:hypothetical protein
MLRQREFLGHSGDWRGANKRLDQLAIRSLQATREFANGSRNISPYDQQNAISATLLVVVPVGILALWLQDRWAEFKRASDGASTARFRGNASIYLVHERPLRRGISVDCQIIRSVFPAAFIPDSATQSQDYLVVKAYPGIAMSSDANPALVHIRRMELRIEQQALSIERLRQFGEDTSAAIRRLSLLRHARRCASSWPSSRPRIWTRSGRSWTRCD